MARQAQTPVKFNRTTRKDSTTTMTSARAGVVAPIAYIPVLRGDSASGRVGIDIELGEMPRPLANGVVANFQAWFVPKSAHPQFSGPDEFMHSYQGEQIKALAGGSEVARDAPPFFNVLDSASVKATVEQSDFFKTLGLHIPPGEVINTDLIDAFVLIYNFRLAAHSSALTRREYATENLANSVKLPPAFWPTGRFSRVVPDYERALIVGALDLDVLAGQVTLPITRDGQTNFSDADGRITGNQARFRLSSSGGTAGIDFNLDPNGELFGDLAGQTIGVTLADIDKARTTQAFAKLRSAYAGNDATGFDNDDAIVATLMQGFNVPSDQFKRPWLLDSARVGVGFTERFATDAANLDASVTLGRASATLSLNVPVVDAGGVIIVTVEVLPERLDERQSDEWLHIQQPFDLPDALRDIQRPEPVDMVLSRRLDARHTTPNLLYGYEPMNDVWNRAATRLGGVFYQDDPTNPFTEQRSAIWQTSIVDPVFSRDHWLAPDDFPHDVFSDTTAPAFEVVSRHDVTLVGLTQIGDMLVENNDDYAAVSIGDDE